MFRPLALLVAVACLASAPVGLAKGKKKKSLKARSQDDIAYRVVGNAERLRAVDEAEAEVRVTTTSKGQKTFYEMDILQASGRRAYLEFTAPEQERGRRMLAIQQRYWSKFPDSRRVVSISRKEMIGNSTFAMADLFQIDTEKDYKPKIVGSKTVRKHLCHEVELKAKHDEAPYHRIVYFVRKKDDYPIMAKFYGVSGKHLKTLTIEKSRKLAGRVRPSLMKMVDETVKNTFSYWKTRKMKIAKVPQEVFSKSYLKGR